MLWTWNPITGWIKYFEVMNIQDASTCPSHTIKMTLTKYHIDTEEKMTCDSDYYKTYLKYTSQIDWRQVCVNDIYIWWRV
jgi:hypothetical protein